METSTTERRRCKSMQLEDYFDVWAPNDIRIKGHRIGIHDVLHDHLVRELTVEELVQRYDTLSLEEILAAILYYLQNKEAMTKYLEDWMEHCRTWEREHRKQNAEFYEKYRRIKEEWRARKQQGSA